MTIPGSGNSLVLEAIQLTAPSSQTAIPCTLIRGGTSKGPFFLASDLPSEPELRDRVLLAVMGSPDPRQIDGIGGADPLTSKVAIVSRSIRPGADVDYLFAQVSIERPFVDITPNCGNLLSGVGVFAIERGLIKPQSPVTPVRIYMVNSGKVAIAYVPTPGGVSSFDGAISIPGVPGTGASMRIDFLDTAGSACGALLPTGNVIDEIEGTRATLIDNGMPVVLLRASDLGKSGYESPAELDADSEFKMQLELIRISAGRLMGLGDVRSKAVPKMTLIAPPIDGGQVMTRTFIPRKCHAAIGVLGAVTVATACILKGSIADGIGVVPNGSSRTISVEHPTGEFTVEIEADEEARPLSVVRSSLVRTARPLFEGHVFVPKRVWEGPHGQQALSNLAAMVSQEANNYRSSVE
jgi:4-oxalomesaconate tautomerase